MTKQQISKVAASLVEHQASFDQLSAEEAQWVITNTVAAIGLFVNAVKNRVPSNVEVVRTLIAIVTSIVRPTTTSSFVAKDHFIGGPFYLEKLFSERFLGKVEGPQGAAIICCHRLLQSLFDSDIVVGLGGHEKAETTLTDIFWLTQQQKKGELGTLLTDGSANIFYVRDIRGFLGPVHVRWIVGKWDLRANQTDHPQEHYHRLQVFSRKSPVGG